ncbi:biotin--[acetyl-CoA-carboxylase] ligase [Chlorobium sp. N1]|uniref:biotin--[acetyl-CoA-carboxylase] ligase n=1 Tax=Chlorobium sp. N1 TaxID=2491138 RepID=UPI00103D38D3|nr:biotin--[acetyl-CoA-carboxylase] ligase [Chlorobium sp. N1]TCD48142.1 biotin--[acetyl-CoA-carboxylase] ligase [Chlorobium sp. N1]
MHDISLSILRRLAASGSFLSGAELSMEFGMTRSAVWKHIRQLRSAGYGVEARTGLGYRLSSMADRPLDVEVEQHLATALFGRRLYWHPSLGSTNTEARAMAAEGAAEGAVVVADLQTAGRGRLGRSWDSPSGVNLYFSLVLRPLLPPGRIPQLTLLLAEAVRRAISGLGHGLRPSVKWPNDIFAEGRKLSGILCEMQSEADRAHFVVAGIGINVNQPSFEGELSGTATSLLLETGVPVSRPALLASVLNHFEPLYRRWHDEPDLGFVLGELEAHAFLRGRRVVVDRMRGVLEGTVTGIAPTGELIITDSDGTLHRVASGEARLRK